MALTAKRQRFVDEYLVDLNATQAAIRAGYSKKAARSCGQRLLTFADVAAAIAAKQKKVAEKLDLDATTVLRDLLIHARTDIRKAYDKNGRLLPVHELPDELALVIGSIKVFEEFEGSGENRVQVGEVRELKFTDRLRALELLGKHLKLFVDKVEHGVDEDLEAVLRRTIERGPSK